MDDRRWTTTVGSQAHLPNQSLSWRVAREGGRYTLAQPPIEIASLAEAGAFLPQGAYTTLRTYGRTGVLALESHFNRLEETAQLLGHPISLPRTELHALLCEVLKGSQWETSPETRLRLTVDCSDDPGNIWISVEPLPLPDPALYEKGVAVLTRPMRRDNPKAKNNAFIEASKEARTLIGGDINEVLMVGDDGRVLEGLSSNFYGARDGIIWTAEEGVLPGITRSLILEEAAPLQIPIRLDALALDELPFLDEAFISSTSRAVLPIVQIDGRAVGNGKPGPLAQTLGAAYGRRIQQEIEPLCEAGDNQL